MQKQREKVYSDLKTLCDSLPAPEGLTKTTSNEMVKPDRGVITNDFKTTLDCKAAKYPYYEYLNLQGWLPTAQGSPYYYKDNFVVEVTCQQNNSETNEKLVQVNCVWDKNGENKNNLK